MFRSAVAGPNAFFLSIAAVLLGMLCNGYGQNCFRLLATPKPDRHCCWLVDFDRHLLLCGILVSVIWLFALVST